MTSIHEWLAIGQAEVAALLAGIDAGEAAALVAAIQAAPRLFVTGQGRSGGIMRMFAIRTMQCGLVTHVVGDATTPAIGRGDLLVVASASGETANPITQATQARRAGATIALVTARPLSALGRLADLIVVVPGDTTLSTPHGASCLPLATAMEQATLALLDAVVASIAQARGQDRDALAARHANLE